MAANMARALPHRALQMCEAEIERLQLQQNDLRRDLERLLNQHGGDEPTLPSSAADPGFLKLANDLRSALAAANKKRQLAVERLQIFEADAEREEHELREELREAQRTVFSVRTKQELASQSVQTDLLRAEIRSAELERDTALRTTAQIELELAPRAADPFDEDVADAAAVDALGADTVENMLRAEATALRTALNFYQEQRKTAVHAKATVKAEEALRRREEAQREESATLDAIEERVRIGRAMVADAMAGSTCRPLDSSDAAVQEAQEKLAKLESDCEELKQSMIPLQEQHGHLQWLRRAAEHRIIELEERFSSLRVTTARAVTIAVDEKELDGVPALIEVMSHMCGNPRIAFLVLDSNHNGRISMCEFDTGLRQRLCLDYKVITGMQLRPLFKEFDMSHAGVIREQDFCKCWTKYEASGTTGANQQTFHQGVPAGTTPRFG